MVVKCDRCRSEIPRDELSQFSKGLEGPYDFLKFDLCQACQKALDSLIERFVKKKLT